MKTADLFSPRFARLWTAIFFLTTSGPDILRAQARMNDRDVEALMRNLNEDTKSFRTSFNSSVGRTAIRRTSEEKDSKNLVQSFQNQTQSMLNSFKKNHKGDAELPGVLASASRIDQLIKRLQFGPQTESRWNKVQNSLSQLAGAYGLGTASDNAAGDSCAAAVGAVRANELVQRCLEVSPATHPPCNIQNSCKLIVDEIKRGCALIGTGAPGYCAEYR